MGEWKVNDHVCKSAWDKCTPVTDTGVQSFKFASSGTKVTMTRFTDAACATPKANEKIEFATMADFNKVGKEECAPTTAGSAKLAAACASVKDAKAKTTTTTERQRRPQ